jgi:hypothetical protein
LFYDESLSYLANPSDITGKQFFKNPKSVDLKNVNIFIFEQAITVISPNYICTGFNVL